MVSQNTEDNAASPGSDADLENLVKQMEADGDFDDTTPPEVDAAVPAEDSSPEPESEATPEPEPVAETQTPDPEPEAEPAPSAETPRQEQSEQRTKLTDIPEFREWQSKRDKDLAELQRKVQEAEAREQQAKQAEQVESQVDEYLRREVQTGIAQGLNEEEAERIVRSPERVKQIRDHFTQQAEIQQYRQAVNLAGKQIAAQKYASENNVAAEDMDILMSAETPEAMEKLAKRIGRATESKNGATQQRRSAVPAETAETAPVSPGSNAPAKPGFWELLEAAESKTYDEMSADEQKAVDMAHAGNFPE